MPESSRSGANTGYFTFAELRQAHADLLRRNGPGGSTGDDSDAIRRIDSFIAAAAASGSHIDKDAERQNAQGILDYWAAELVSLSELDAATWTPPRLAEAVPEALRAAAPAAAVPGTGEGTVGSMRSGTGDGGLSGVQIRLAATARQWKQSGNSGYLLSGDALEEAERFVNVDPDIRLLVEASRELVAQRERRRKFWLSVLSAVLLIGFAVLGALAYGLYRQRQEVTANGLLAIQRTYQADVAEFLANSKRLALAGQQIATDGVRDKALESAETAQSRLAELERTQRLLDATLQALRRHGGNLSRSDLPEDVWTALQAPASAAPVPALERGGYNPAFIGPLVPFPRIREPGRGDYGHQRDYFNFSVLPQPDRLMPRVSASNLDRQQLRVLPRGDTTFRIDGEMGNQQSEAASFRDGLQPATLVSRQEVAWGALHRDPSTAARQLNAVVYTYANAVPQWPAFRNRVWDRLESWVLTEHNKSASKVSIFAGPVLDGAGDPQVGGFRLPQAYWKIAVSQPLDSGSSLVVDAFLVPQASRAEAATDGDFDPQRYRVRVERIEQLTGLDFGPALRAAPTAAAATAAQAVSATASSDSFVELTGASVDQLNAADASLRRSTADGFVTMLRNDYLPTERKLGVVRAVVDSLERWAADPAGANGLYNAWVVLDQVPAANWNRPEWQETRDATRRFVLQWLKNSGAANPATKARIDATLARLGWSLPLTYQVDLQYTGIDAASAKAASAGLRALGWNVRGEEQVAQAPAGNEIRYGDPADEPAARLLAADLRVPGGSRTLKVQAGIERYGQETRKRYQDVRVPTAAETPRVVQVSAIKKGKLEIWIGR